MWEPGYSSNLTSDEVYELLIECGNTDKNLDVNERESIKKHIIFIDDFSEVRMTAENMRSQSAHPNAPEGLAPANIIRIFQEGVSGSFVATIVNIGAVNARTIFNEYQNISGATFHYIALKFTKEADAMGEVKIAVDILDSGSQVEHESPSAINHYKNIITNLMRIINDQYMPSLEEFSIWKILDAIENHLTNADSLKEGHLKLVQDIPKLTENAIKNKFNDISQSQLSDKMKQLAEQRLSPLLKQLPQTAPSLLVTLHSLGEASTRIRSYQTVLWPPPKDYPNRLMKTREKEYLDKLEQRYRSLYDRYEQLLKQCQEKLEKLDIHPQKVTEKK